MKIQDLLATAEAAAVEAAAPVLQRYALSYAYDVSKYADFSIEAESEEEALRIAQALLDHGAFPNELIWSAEECDGGSDNDRVFVNSGALEGSSYRDITDFETEDDRMPENWRELQPMPEPKLELNQYQRENAIRLIDGYYFPRPDDKEGAPFERAKAECVKRLKEQLSQVEAIDRCTFITYRRA